MREMDNEAEKEKRVKKKGKVGLKEVNKLKVGEDLKEGGISHKGDVAKCDLEVETGGVNMKKNGGLVPGCEQMSNRASSRLLRSKVSRSGTWEVNKELTKVEEEIKGEREKLESDIVDAGKSGQKTFRSKKVSFQLPGEVCNVVEKCLMVVEAAVTQECDVEGRRATNSLEETNGDKDASDQVDEEDDGKEVPCLAVENCCDGTEEEQFDLTEEVLAGEGVKYAEGSSEVEKMEECRTEMLELNELDSIENQVMEEGLAPILTLDKELESTEEKSLSVQCASVNDTTPKKKAPTDEEEAEEVEMGLTATSDLQAWLKVSIFHH